MESKLTYRLVLAIFILSTLGLFTIAALGIFVRPAVDDLYYLSYDNSEPLRTFNLLTNGRITSLMIYGIFYQIPFFLQLVPLLSVIIIFLGFYIPLRIIFKRYFNSQPKLLLLAIAASTSLAVCLLTPGLYTSLFWFAAAPVHTWPFSFILLYIGLLLDNQRTKEWSSSIKIITYALIPLGIGLLYETSSILLILISAATLVVAYRKKLTHYTRIGWLSLAGSLLSLGILFFSPGAIRRRDSVASATDTTLFDRITQLPDVVWHNLTVTYPLLFERYEILIILAAGVALVPILFLKKDKAPSRKAVSLTLLLTVISLLVVLIINTAIIYLGVESTPPLRAYFLPTLVLCVSVAIIGFILGIAIRQLAVYRQGIALGALLTTIIIFISINYAFVPYLKSFYSTIKIHTIAWDERDEKIKAALSEGKCDIQVNNLPIKGIGDISSDKNHWRNTGISGYYGFPEYGECRVYAKSIQ